MLYQYGAHNCSRTVTLEEGGKWWCKQHVPSIVAARREKRNSEWEKKWAAECAAADHKAALTSAERAVIEAAVEHARCRHGIVEDVVNGTFIPNDSVREMETTGRQLDAAVDALLAAREGR